MKLGRKILFGTLGLLTVALVALAVALSHNSACGAPTALPAQTATMQAIVYRCYGSPEVLKLESIAKPMPADDEVLVRVRAASVNPLDWHYMRGEPYVMRLSSGFGRPNDTRVGVDFAGVVEAVGKNVTRFKAGDEVFGGRGGALGDYVVIREQRAIAPKPANLTFEEAATVPIAGVTALQALRDKGQLKPGQKVLINGASGGVGTFAVQIAKAMGAEVTGVTSTRNVELVRSLGADHVIDYKQQDFTQSGERYDLIIDNVGNHPLRALRRVMPVEGIVVIVGGQSHDPWLGPLTRSLGALVLAPFVSQKFEGLLADLNQDEMNVLSEMLESGKVKPVIDRRYSLSETPAAIAYLEEGRARGKVVVSVSEALVNPTRSIEPLSR